LAIPPLQGLDGATPPPAGDIANSVVTGTFSAVGPGIAVAFRGAFNVAIYATLNDPLTTTEGSTAATVTSGAALQKGAAINSTLVPAGSTVASIAVNAITIALPTISLECSYQAGSNILTGIPPQTNAVNSIDYLVGATIISADYPVGTKVISVGSEPGPRCAGLFVGGTLVLSQNAINGSAPAGSPVGGSGANRVLFTLGPASITGGTDANAAFSGSGIGFAATVELQRSFDGGSTWVTANIGGAGQLAQYNVGTPVSFFAGDPERGVTYRLNCIAYTPTANITLNYRMSTTGQAAETLSIATI
jgi:hypothetical protein